MTGSSAQVQMGKPRPITMLAMLIGSLAGLAISLCTHLVSLLGRDPGSFVNLFWVFQLLLIGLAAPIAVELFRPQPAGGVLRSPRWMRWTLYGLLGYYGLNFYVFLYWSSMNLSAAVTWRMFSAGWLLLFAVAAVFYRVRYREALGRMS